MEKKINRSDFFCDACGADVTKQKWKPSLDLTKHDEEFTAFDDLCENCYHKFWEAINNTVDEIRKDDSR